ncbi:MAG TPA: hypothetical protein VGH87_00640 [Polyangiaceae bacterium]
MKKIFLVGLALAACGGQTTNPGDGGGPDVAPDTTTSAGSTFAVRRVYLGESDRTTGTPSATAWESYGRNIDGLVTTAVSTDVCTLAAGAVKADQIDGNNGIDNAWGSTLLPVFQTAASLQTPSIEATASIDGGQTTLLVSVSGLTDDPAQTATGLKAHVVAGGTYNGTPAFDATTSWPALANATAVDFDASITNGVFTTAPGNAPLAVAIPIASIVIVVLIHDPVISFTHTDHASATNGTIAGVLDTNEFIAAFDAIAGELSASLCGSAKTGIDDQFRQASDILVDGTNQSGTPCTGISIGIDFDATLVGAPASTAPIAGPSNPCP